MKRKKREYIIEKQQKDFTILKRKKRFRFKESSIVGQESVGSKFERVVPVSGIRVDGPLHGHDHGAARYIVTTYLHILDEQIIHFYGRKLDEFCG